jgi:hypothetical protein
MCRGSRGLCPCAPGRKVHCRRAGGEQVSSSKSATWCNVGGISERKFHNLCNLLESKCTPRFRQTGTHPFPGVPPDLSNRIPPSHPVACYIYICNSARTLNLCQLAHLYLRNTPRRFQHAHAHETDATNDKQRRRRNFRDPRNAQHVPSCREQNPNPKLNPKPLTRRDARRREHARDSSVYPGSCGA